MSRAYYMVDSVKGGCGKSTFAFMLSQFLREKTGMGTCLLDFDFLGTGFINLSLGDDPSKIREFEKRYSYITDAVMGVSSAGRSYLYPCEYRNDCSFYVSYSNPKFYSKTAYRLRPDRNFSPAVLYSAFRKGVLEILRENGSIDINGRNINNVVMDMSPGMDTYSEIVKECVYDKRHSRLLGDDIKRFYFLMTGMDLSHIVSTENYLEAYLDGQDKFSDRIFIVINDPMCGGKMLSGIKNVREIEIYNAIVDKFIKRIKLPEIYIGKVFFLVLNHYSEYSAKIHFQEPLIENGYIHPDIFLPIPFRYACSWETGCFQNVVLPEDCSMGVETCSGKGDLMRWLTE